MRHLFNFLACLLRGHPCDALYSEDLPEGHVMRGCRRCGSASFLLKATERLRASSIKDGAL
jgi:predicted  nucleic acid-binding Zn-ribbon protein